jgi:hypothetical protein
VGRRMALVSRWIPKSANFTQLWEKNSLPFSKNVSVKDFKKN